MTEAADPSMVLDFTGSGKKVLRVPQISTPVLLFFEVSNSTGHTSLVPLNSSGDRLRALVNALGTYRGVTLLNMDSPVSAFEISADGPWSLRARPLTSARAWSTPQLCGDGDDVLELAEPVTGLATLTLEAASTDHIAVTAYSQAGSRLVFNEIGPFSGEAILPVDSRLLELRCQGPWTLTRG